MKTLLLFFLLGLSLSLRAQQSTYTYDPPGNLTAEGSTGIGPPAISADPQSQLLQTNSPVQFSVFASGAGLSYQWLSSGVLISGATGDTLMLSSNAAGVWVVNGGAEFTNGSQAVVLTDLHTSEARSTFYTVPQNITNFSASFTYQDVGGGGADGVAFVLQNTPAGPMALGALGGSFGYGGIGTSAAIEFNVYAGGAYAEGITLATNGNVVQVYGSPSPVNLGGGDPINVAVNYTSGVLGVALNDTVTGALFATNYQVNLAGLVGGPTAYVGFTGGSGSVGAYQQVANFSFLSSGSSMPVTFAPAAFSVVVSNIFGVVTSTPAALWEDSNGNGIPDWWELKYFGNLNQTALGDYDGDGVDNLDEYLEGTDPTNSHSYDPRLTIQTIRGKVVAVPNLPFYTNGEEITLTALPDAGETFLSWSGAVSGAKPTIAMIITTNTTVTASFGLPLGVALDNTNLTWTAGGTAPWFGQAPVSEDGVDAAQSGLITDGQQSTLQTVTNLSQPMVLMFWWNVSSLSPDGLSFYVDGTLKFSISGPAVGWQHVTTTLATGSHTLLWVYSKGSADQTPSGVAFADTAWLDEVALGVAPQITGLSASQIVAQGSNVVVSVTASGSLPLNVQWYFNGTALPGANSGSLLLNNIQSASAGAYMAVVTNLFGSVTSAVSRVIVNSSSCTAPPAGLVDWWPGDGNSIDVAGGQNGLLQDGASYTNGLVGQAFNFNGVSNYVQLPINCFPFPTSGTATNPFSLALWFETTTGGVILGQQNAYPFQTPSGYVPMIYVGTDGLVHAEMFWGGTGTPISSLGPVNDGNFHLLAMIYDGTTLTMWVDGVTNSSKSYVENSFTSQYYYQFGTGYSTGRPATPGGWYSFGGIIDEPAFFSRALSGAEVQSIYGSGGAGLCKPIAFVSGVTPSSAAVGSGVTISGTNLFGVTNVSFNGVSANFSILSNQQIFALVPANATSGPLILTGVGGIATAPNSFTVISNPSCDAPPAGLIAWWPADGNGQDIVGGHTATNQGGVTFTTGKSGQAFTFDGSTGSVDLGNWFNLQTFSISMWINPSAAQQSYTDIIDNNHSSSTSWFAEYQNTGLLFDWGEFWGPGEEGVVPFNLTSNIWQHLVVSVDATFVNRVYLNGVLVSATQQRPINYDGTQFLRLGRWGGGGRYFKGQIDEVAIFNRALSTNEIQNLYISDSASMCAPVPIILGVTPTNGISGDVVAIQGTNFFTISRILFNGVAANFTIPVNGGLVVYVPTNATSGPITIVTPNGSFTALQNFTILPGAQCTPPASGLVSWWPGNGNALDSAGTNNGTLVGAVTFTNGEVGQAFGFNGTSSYVEFPASSSLNVGAGSGFTIEAWINPQNVSERPLVEWNNGSSSAYGVHFWISVPFTGGGGVGSIYANVVDIQNNTHNFTSVPGIVTTNLFQHLALTYNQTNGIGTIYYNGIAVASTYLGVFTPQTSYNLYLGYRPGYTPTAAQMLEDEVSIFNRALSSTEIQAIYNAGVSGFCSSTPEVVNSPSQGVTNGLVFGASPSTMQWTSNGLHLQLNGLNGQGPAIIYASSNLENWIPIYTNPPATGTIQLHDFSSTNIPIRFYRAVEQ